MFTTIRRIALILATSSGVIAATTLAAHAGTNFRNHCEPGSPADPAGQQPLTEDSRPVTAMAGSRMLATGHHRGTFFTVHVPRYQ